MAPVHYLSEGDLVTRAGSTWSFELAPGIRLAEDEQILWYKGTATGGQSPAAGEDSDTTPDGPVTYVPAGRGIRSDPITFSAARPVFVSAAIQTFDRERVVPRPGAPALGDILVKRDLQELTPGATGGDILSGATTVDRRSTGPRTTGGEDPPAIGGPAVFDAREDAGRVGGCVVYPGKVEIEAVPKVIAQATEGYLPVLLHFYGLSGAVRITGYRADDSIRQIKYSLVVKDQATRVMTEVTDRFTRARGAVDKPCETQENGLGVHYIVYMSPEEIRTLGRLGVSPLAQDVFLRLFVNAKPMQTSAKRSVRLTAASRDIGLYVDDRANLQHFKTYATWQSYGLAKGDSSGAASARRFIHVQSPEGFETRIERPDNRRTALDGIPGTVAELSELSAPDGSDVNIVAKVLTRPPNFRETGAGTAGAEGAAVGEVIDGLAFGPLLQSALAAIGMRVSDPKVSLRYEVEGAQRSALVLPYYRLAQASPKVLGKGRHCLIGRLSGDAGSLRVRLHRAQPNATVGIGGLLEADRLFDPAGVTSSAVAAVAAVVAIGSAWTAAALSVCAAVAGVLWSRTPGALQTRTAGEVYVQTGLNIFGLKDGIKRLDNPRKRPPVRQSGNGEGPVDIANDWDSLRLTVGEGLNVYQIASVGLHHRILQGATMYAGFKKTGYDMALEVAAE